jgi:hypothetical protein
MALIHARDPASAGFARSVCRILRVDGFVVSCRMLVYRPRSLQGIYSSHDVLVGHRPAA